MQLYSLAVAVADIRHSRYLPKPYGFQSQLSYLWFDPEKLDQITQASPLWSAERWNLLSLNTADFLAKFDGTISEKVLQVLQRDHISDLPDIEHIRILALPRTLGFRFNSVVFYYLYNADQQLQMVLSEITNTPWLERQVYVHDCRDQAQSHSEFQSYTFEFQKAFHVSPFMPIDMDYKWKFSFSDQQQIVFMQLFKEEKLQFDVSMRFSLVPITLPSQQHHYAVYKVFEPLKMVTGIYYHALKLWLKKIPFYRHPKKTKDTL